MMAHDWPGNVRELGNVVERALTLTTSPVISAAEFAPVFSLGRAVPSPRPAPDEREAISPLSNHVDGTTRRPRSRWESPATPSGAG